MKKEQKRILIICMFLLIGCILGYFVADTQIQQFHKPEYIAFWTSKNMPVPQPLGYAKSIVSFALLFSGIPTGLIFYNAISTKWLTATAPKLIIGFISFPIYVLIGVIGSVPLLFYTVIHLFRNHK